MALGHEPSTTELPRLQPRGPISSRSIHPSAERPIFRYAAFASECVTCTIVVLARFSFVS